MRWSARCVDAPPAFMAAPVTTIPFDAACVRADFPALRQRIHGRALVYLDSAASALKPQPVIDRLSSYYALEHSNVHRGVHYLSQRATDAYEAARSRIADFIKAAHAHEIIFTRGTTEAVNLVANTFGHRYVSAGDEIIITVMEHHSNMVPWQLLCARANADLRVVPVSQQGTLDANHVIEHIGERTRLIAIAHVSNTLGSVNPVEEIIAAAHAENIPVLLDGAQSLPHLPINVQALNCDFYCASGHKVYGPTGIGFLYAKEAILEDMPPWQGGGDMIEHVTPTRAAWAELPHKFEAGTPHIAGALGLHAALDYIEGVGIDAIHEYESEVLQYAILELQKVSGLRLIGEPDHRVGAISFLLEQAHPYDIGQVLDRAGIAVRTGHHCTMPLMAHLGVCGTVRASFGLYNTHGDVDALVAGLQEAKRVLYRSNTATATGRAAPTTIMERQKDLFDELALFEDPDDRREYLMELGDELGEFPDQYRTEANRIRGCQAMVWLHTEKVNGRLQFKADSDALITRGLIAVVVGLLNDQTPQAILSVDLEAIMISLGLPDLITAQRKNGLAHMIARMNHEAISAL